MDIRKGDSYRGSDNVSFGLVFVGAIILLIGRDCCADVETAINVLARSYNFGPAITAVEAKSAIAELEGELDGCGGGYLAFRIRYRIALMHFKAGEMEVSKTRFLRIVNNPECPELIRICSFNMIGQISRLEGKHKEALEAFGQVLNLLEESSSAGTSCLTDPVLSELRCSALFSRAEIYELRQNFAASIRECIQLLGLVEKNKTNKVLIQYALLANDKISQLYLRSGDVDQYIKFAEALVTNHPEYRRNQMVRFEIICIEFLRSIGEVFEFSDGSFSAPAQLIAHLKSSNDKRLVRQVAEKLDRLCKEPPNISSEILLHYNYAWFLDAVGQRDKAIEILSRVHSSGILGSNGKGKSNSIAEIITEYAKIQHAIMLSEKAKYKQAQRVLSSLQEHTSQSHISSLAKSVNESIKILKREVPKNESN